MHNSSNKRRLQILLFILIAVLTLGIGYASISSINLIINGNAISSVNDANFDVHFISTVDTPSLSGNVIPIGDALISQQDNKVALFDVGGMTKVGDYVIAIYTIMNNSNGIGAIISLNLTNSNNEYFKVTETVSDSQLQAGDTTTGIIKVEMIKTPVDDNVTSNIVVTLIANPIENEQATGSSSSSKTSDYPVSFATDSWTTIKKAVQDNNTSLYNIGDTKNIRINNSDYTVRIANKSTYDWCEDEKYSQTSCGFVVEFVVCPIEMQMRDTDTNIGGYPATNAYDYLKNTLYEQLPEDLKFVIKPTRVISGHGISDSTNFITMDNLYLLSEEEVFGVDAAGHNFYDTAVGTSHQLEYYSINDVSYETSNWRGVNLNKAVKQYDSSNAWWLLRPASSINNDHFVSIGSDGGLNYIFASQISCVAPVFRIG